MEFHLDILENCFGGEKQSTSKWQIQKKMFTMFEYDMLLLMPYVKCMWISNLKEHEENESLQMNTKLEIFENFSSYEKWSLLWNLLFSLTT